MVNINHNIKENAEYIKKLKEIIKKNRKRLTATDIARNRERSEYYKKFNEEVEQTKIRIHEKALKIKQKQTEHNLAKFIMEILNYNDDFQTSKQLKDDIFKTYGIEYKRNSISEVCTIMFNKGILNKKSQKTDKAGRPKVLWGYLKND